MWPRSICDEWSRVSEDSKPNPELVALEDYQVNPDLAWTGDENTVTILNLAQPAAKPLQISGPLAQAFIWIHQGIQADADATLIEQLSAVSAVLPMRRSG